MVSAVIVRHNALSRKSMVYTNFSGTFFQNLCIITTAPAGKTVAGAV